MIPTTQKINKPNIVLITIDSLRPDFLGCYGSDKNVSRNIDSLAKRSLLFEDAITPSAPTYLAFQSIMCGIKPFQYGKYLGVPPVKGVKTIAESLKDKGYSTYAIVSDNPVLYGKNYQYDRGFDQYIDYKNQNVQIKKDSPHKKFIKSLLSNNLKNKLFLLHSALKKLFSKSPIIDANEINNKALELMGSNKEKPFFMWLHYMDVHTPYSSGYKYFDLYGRYSLKNLFAKLNLIYNLNTFIEKMKIPGQENLRTAVSMYEASLKYLDEELGRLFKSIDQNNTYVILVSDHGECFMEHGSFYHEAFSVYNELIKIPLLICGPDIEPGRKRGLASSINIAKTICAISNASSEHFEGFNLIDLDTIEKEKYLSINNITKVLYKCKFFSLLFNQYLFDNKVEIKNYQILSSIIKDNLKYIFNDETLIEELYNLTDDPGERNNIAESNKDICLKLKKILKD